jgi:TRAP-type C4-dicarboxylate transport system substrate-binding protein
MFYKIGPSVFVAVLLAFVAPGSAEIGRAQQAQDIKISMLAPRDSPLYFSFKKMGDKISKATNKAWGLKIFASGVAGDEKDAIRKMQVGQIDGAVVTTTGLSIIEPQAAIFDAPGVIINYEQLEAVEKQMDPEIAAILEKKNVTVLTSWEGGQYRLFLKGFAKYPSDLKSHRMWLWPESYILKAIWREVGASGVPLGAIDVFGALQTGMIDGFMGSAYTAVQMRWHSKLDHVSARAQGVLIFWWIMNKTKWDALPENVKQLIINDLPATRQQAKRDARRDDEAAYNALLKRGYTALVNDASVNKMWDDLLDRVSQKLTGRLWPDALFKRMKAITSKIKS